MTQEHITPQHHPEHEAAQQQWVDRLLAVDERKLMDFTYGEDTFSGVLKSERRFPDGSRAYEIEYTPDYVERHGADNLPRFVYETALINPRLRGKNGLNEHLTASADASAAAELSKPAPEAFDPHAIDNMRYRPMGAGGAQPEASEPSAEDLEDDRQAEIEDIHQQMNSLVNTLSFDQQRRIHEEAEGQLAAGNVTSEYARLLQRLQELQQ